ncbi:MAG TPA: hypothetical protein VMD30_09475 [Tepidisphaeraceae bacterium]|nr:hypothetical protein [Tepidisphaeraceae bacterium]
MDSTSKSPRRLGLILLAALAVPVIPVGIVHADDGDVGSGIDSGQTLDPSQVGISTNSPELHPNVDSPDAYPRPSPFQVSWELTFTHSNPKRIVLTLPGRLAPTAFWYITYRVTNNSDQQANYDPDKYQPIVFYPHFEMRTREGKVISSDDSALPAVFDAIKNREGDPMLIPPGEMGGLIQIGPDHAKDGVAIFAEPDLRMGSFSIFVSGMWGETSTVIGPDGKPLKDAKGNTVELHKTLMLNYHVDGDDNPGNGVLRKTGEQFIMR